MQRIKGEWQKNGTTYRKRYYAANFEATEFTDLQTNTTDNYEACYIFAPTGLCAILAKENGTESMNYIYTDYLGSINTVYNQTSNTIIVDRNYDAWGRERDAVTLNYISSTTPEWLSRGFEGHEMLTDFALINMNGRVYDPVIGQFISADPVLQDENNCLNYNKYCFAFNNPLKYIDPTGCVIEYADAGYTFNTYDNDIATTGSWDDRLEISDDDDGHRKRRKPSDDERRSQLTGDPDYGDDDDDSPDPRNDEFLHGRTITNTDDINDFYARVEPAQGGGGIKFPSFATLNLNYPHDINGEHQHPSSNPKYHNQCAIRMSDCLIKSGVSLTGYPTDDLDVDFGKWALTANRLKYYISQNNGNYVKMSQSNFESSKYWNQTGIIYIAPPPGGVGHIDIFEGNGKTGSGYYLGSEIWFWPIK